MQQRLEVTAALAVMVISGFVFASSAQAMPVGDAPGKPIADRSEGEGPIEKAACWGWGWRGPGVYVAPLGLRAACWYPPVYGAPVYVAPGYAPPVVVAPVAPSYVAPATYYYCDNPRGYYPRVPSCSSGWRPIAAAP